VKTIYFTGFLGIKILKVVFSVENKNEWSMALKVFDAV
jgi:hypothetical protein